MPDYQYLATKTQFLYINPLRTPGYQI